MVGKGVCMCVYGEGGGLPTVLSEELLTSQITTVCQTKRQLYNILIMTELSEGKLLPNFDQALSGYNTNQN